MRLALSTLLVSSIIVGVAQAANVASVGYELPVMSEDYYTVKNPDGIGHYRFNESDCKIVVRGTLRVMNYDTATKQYLIEFVHPVATPNQSECPTGTIFLMKEEDFTRRVELFNKEKEANEQERVFILKLLEDITD